MTEIQWLVDLMLNHKLPEPVKQKFIARIGEVEAQLSRPAQKVSYSPPVGLNTQAPSMQRILEDVANETPAPIVSSPVVAQALANRQQAIAAAVSDRPERGRTSPRKF